jgi:hypothetical protein
MLGFERPDGGHEFGTGSRLKIDGNIRPYTH